MSERLTDEELDELAAFSDDWPTVRRAAAEIRASRASTPPGGLSDELRALLASPPASSPAPVAPLTVAAERAALDLLLEAMAVFPCETPGHLQGVEWLASFDESPDTIIAAGRALICAGVAARKAGGK